MKKITFTNRSATTAQMLAIADTAKSRAFEFQMPPAIRRRLATADVEADTEHELNLGFLVEEPTGTVVRCLACVNLPGSDVPICGLLDIDPELHETLPVVSEMTVLAIPIPVPPGRSGGFKQSHEYN